MTTTTTRWALGVGLSPLSVSEASLNRIRKEGMNARAAFASGSLVSTLITLRCNYPGKRVDVAFAPLTPGVELCCVANRLQNYCLMLIRTLTVAYSN